MSVDRTKLKCCPFCGTDSIYKHDQGVKCLGCNSESQSVIIWNTRSSPWITLKSEADLPKDDGDYLIVDNRGDPWLAKREDEFHFKVFNSVNRYTHDIYVHNADVTHYMPIPDAEGQ